MLAVVAGEVALAGEFLQVPLEIMSPCPLAPLASSENLALVLVVLAVAAAELALAGEFLQAPLEVVSSCTPRPPASSESLTLRFPLPVVRRPTAHRLNPPKFPA